MHYYPTRRSLNFFTQHKEGAMQKAAKSAITMLRGTVTVLPATATLVEACSKLLPLISKLFGLG